MANKPWPIEVRVECVRLRKAGWSLQQIEAEKGVPIRTVRHWCDSKKKESHWSESTKQKCLELRKAGHTYKDITRHTGVPDATQRAWYPEELKSFRGKPKQIKLSDYMTTTEYRGLRYKIGRNGRLFYKDTLGEWVKSTLDPKDVGLAAY